MKLGRWQISLRRVTAAEEPRKTAPPELGASGTINLGGFLDSEDHNSDLRFPQSISTYRRMRRSDPAVREAEQHIFAPIKNATFDVEPASDDPADLTIAAAARCAYFKWLHRGFDFHLAQALTYLSYGFQVFEQVWQVVEEEVEYDHPETGEPVTVPSRQYLTWRRFAQRLPETIWKWNMEDGELVSIAQQAMHAPDGEFKEVTIGADDPGFLLFVSEQEGDDFYGQSILRTAYKPWFLKEEAEKTAARAIMRHGVGTWIAYPPTSAENDEKIIGRLEDILKGVGLGDLPYIVAPGRKGTETQDGYAFEVITPGGQLPEIVDFLQYLRGDIKGNMLARFAELGQGQTGARATSDSQSEVWYAALHGVASFVASVHNQDAIPRFVQANFGGATRYPKLIVRDIEVKNLAEFADAHYKLVAAGAVLPDLGYREFVRRSLDAPDEDEDAEEQTKPDIPEPLEPDEEEIEEDEIEEDPTA